MNVHALSRLLFAVIWVSTFVVQAALPPLSKDDLDLRASHILTGYIYMVQDHEIDVSGGKDILYVAKMLVHESEKGGYAQNNIVQFTFKRVKSRPMGWTGNTGQHSVIKPHRAVRIWLNQDEQGNLVLLEPNGWEHADYAGNP